MTRKNALSIAVADFYKDREILETIKRRGSEFLIIPENYHTLLKLSESNLKFYYKEPIGNIRQLEITTSRINLLKEEWSTNSYLADVFAFDGENFAYFLKQRMTAFLGRSLVNYEIIKGLFKNRQIKELYLFKNPQSSISGSFAIHESLLDISFWIFLKIKGIKINKVFLRIKLFAEDKIGARFVIGSILKVKSLIISLVDKFLTRAKIPGNKIKVLFVIPGNHIKLVIPVFKELEREKIEYLLVSYNLLNKHKILLLKNNIKFLKSKDFYSVDIWKESEIIAHKMRSRWHKIKKTYDISWGKGLIKKFFRETISYKVENVLNHEIGEVIRDYLVAKHIIREYKPKLLISTTDPDARVLPYIRVAKRAGIRSITIQHGAFLYPYSVDFESDKMLAWGPYYKKWFIQNLSKKPAQIEVCGSLEFDKSYKRKAFHNRNKIETVLILSSFYYLKPIEFENDLANLIENLSRMGFKKILIRTHPYQKLYFIENLANHSEVVEMANSGSVDDILSKADLVISTDTTAVVNAIISGRIVIYWPFYKKEYLPIRKFRAALTALSIKEIIQIVNKIRNNKIDKNSLSKNKFIKQVCFKLDGKAFVRIAKKISAEVH